MHVRAWETFVRDDEDYYKNYETYGLIGELFGDFLPEEVALYLIEEAPRYHRIEFLKKQYIVPLPWLYYVYAEIKSHGMFTGTFPRIYSRSDALTSASNKFSIAPIPNLEGGDSPCFQVPGIRKNWPFEKRFAHVYARWQHSQSNNDYTYETASLLKSRTRKRLFTHEYYMFEKALENLEKNFNLRTIRKLDLRTSYHIYKFRDIFPTAELVSKKLNDEKIDQIAA